MTASASSRGSREQTAAGTVGFGTEEFDRERQKQCQHPISFLEPPATPRCFASYTHWTRRHQHADVLS